MLHIEVPCANLIGKENEGFKVRFSSSWSSGQWITKSVRSVRSTTFNDGGGSVFSKEDRGRERETNTRDTFFDAEFRSDVFNSNRSSRNTRLLVDFGVSHSAFGQL